MISSPLKLEIIRDEERFFALASDWESLHQRSAVRTPFRTWDWTRLWWKHFKDRFQLRVGVLHSTHDQIEAIAPFVLGNDDNGPRRHLRHLTFLGGMGDVVSEGLDFLVPADQEQALLPHFEEMFHALRSEWEVIDIPYLQAQSPSLPVISTLLSRVGNSAPRSQPNIGHVLALASTWDEQLASFSRNRRSDIRSKWKKLMTQHQGRALIGGQEISSTMAMDVLFALHQRRFTDATSTFLAPRAQAFHRELVELWHPSGRVILSLLEADGTYAAARYGFVFENRYWDYQSGFDEQFAHLSIGNLNLSWAVQNAIARGLKEYDHLAGDQAYKHAWSTHTRRYLHLESLNSRSLSAQFFKLSRSIKRFLSRPAPAPSELAAASKPTPVSA